MMFGNLLCKTLLHLSLGIRVSTTHKELHFLQRNPSLLTLRYISSTSNQQHSFTVSYLINSCGFSPESALSASKRVNFETPEKPDSVLAFFNNHGFSKTQTSKIIRYIPTLLLSNPDKTLLPKIKFFYSQGFSSLELAHIVSLNPVILQRSLDNELIPNFEFLKSLLQSDKKMMRALKRSARLLSFNLHTYVAANIDVLRDSGVPEANIMSFLPYQPMLFATRCDKFKEVVEEVKKMGFDPLRLLFVLAIHVLRSLSKSTWDRKVEIYKRWDWSREQTLQAFKKYPLCMMISEDKVMANMDFFVNKMGWEPSAFAIRPQLIALSLDKRIVPRCSVAQVLLSRGLIKKDFNFNTLLQYPEKMFLQRFVTRYKDEVPELLKLYHEKMGLSKR